MQGTTLSPAQWGRAADYLARRGYKGVAGECASSALGARSQLIQAAVVRDWERSDGQRVIVLGPAALDGLGWGRYQRLVLTRGHEKGVLSGHDGTKCGTPAQAAGYARSRERVAQIARDCFGVGAGFVQLSMGKRSSKVWLDDQGRPVRFIVLDTDPGEGPLPEDVQSALGAGVGS